MCAVPSGVTPLISRARSPGVCSRPESRYDPPTYRGVGGPFPFSSRPLNLADIGRFGTWWLTQNDTNLALLEIDETEIVVTRLTLSLYIGCTGEVLAF